MLNKIWFWLLCIGIVYGFCKSAYQSANEHRNPTAAPAAVTSSSDAKAAQSGADAAKAAAKEPGLTAMGKRLNGAVLEAAKSAVDICLPLIGIMALWLGLMNVAKDAGLIALFARLVRPVMRWLFPEVPDGHPAHGAMLMNISANMLGLDNAATPMGIKAMEELQTLNPVKDTASNSMALFLAINCGSVTLIPFTIIGYRFASGSKDPSGIIVGTLLASMASVVAGVSVARWLSRSPKYKVAAEPLPKDGSAEARTSSEGESPSMTLSERLQAITVFMESVSQWAIPALIMLVIMSAAYNRVPMYESFVTGAKEGFGVAVMIIPYLVTMFLAIKIFVASGIFDDIKYGLSAAMTYLKLGAYTESLDLLPLAMTKPLTGSGARGVMLEIFHLHGPDSFLGKTASIMMGSSETTFYILTVYFGAVGVKKVRHTLIACLCADAAGMGTAVVLGYLMYHGR